MLKLRQYKPSDANEILTWCKDELTFRRWTSDRYESFPITAEEMNQKYVDNNGDCTEEDNFYPMTAFDEEGPAGHMVMRYTDEAKTTLRFGFVIVDASKRGKGYGKKMIQLALKYAFEIYGAKKVTIGAFENNPSAYHCYKAAGFEDAPMAEISSCRIFGETWRVLELEIDKTRYAMLQ